ncbi:MAG: hypothetical protein A2017_10620 [Lentisphaerae bacterium GWF2_44_16]|nr:MAG: hypothetical protein A2017_10620 [Lentisphaerae bacterium GWF2_44_16]
MACMGIDIGTSGCKAVVFNEDGKELSHSYREYSINISADGRAELDSSKVIESCFDVIREASGKSPEKVHAIGISSQGEAFTPVDAKGRILGNAMVSFDTRANEITEKEEWKNLRRKLYDITGHSSHPMFTLFKLQWLKKNRNDLYGAADKFLCFEDLLEMKLGVKKPAMGWPLAGRTMLFDVKKHQWDDEILDLCGLSSDNLARPLKSGSIAGTISPETAKSLSLTDNVIVVAGGHDQPCGALGAGAVDDGCAMYATGTVECICPVVSSLIQSDELYKSNLCSYDYTLKNLYTTVAFSLTGGNILKWFRDEFGSVEVTEARKQGLNPYELILKNMSQTPSSLMVLPYFTPSGTPYFDTEAEGAVLGLKLSTTRGEFMRALLEGVAFEMRLNLDILNKAGIKINELRAIGGGAKSPAWTQLKADVMNKPVSIVETKEAGCLGVAMLAHSSCSGEKIESVIGRWVKTSGVIHPNPENAEYYNKRFELYKDLYPSLKKNKVSTQS